MGLRSKNNANAFLTFRYLPVILVIGLISAIVPQLPHTWGHYVFWFQQAFFLFLFFSNRHIKPIRLFSIGYIMNGIAIVAGGGKMPALVPLEVLSKVESSVKYTPFDSINPLHWLGDSILIPNMKLVASPVTY